MKYIFIPLCFLFSLNISFAQMEPSQYLQQGIDAVNAKAFNDAVGFLNQYLDSDPQNTIARYYRALAYYNLRDFENALQDATIAVTNNNMYKEAFNVRGLINTSLSILSDALSDFSSAIFIDPSYAEAYLNRAMIYKIQNNYPDAVADLNNAINSNPALLEAYYIRGEVFSSMGNYNDALKDFNTYIKNVIDKAAAYASRGLVFYQLGEYDKSAADLEKAVSLNPELEKDLKSVLIDAKNKQQK